MEYHFVKLNVNGTYLSLVDPTQKSRFMCFRDKKIADKCIEYVSSFRARRGVWPSFDMSTGMKKIIKEPNVSAHLSLKTQSLTGWIMHLMNFITEMMFKCGGALKRSQSQFVGTGPSAKMRSSRLTKG